MIGVRDGLRPAVPGLMHRVDGQRGAMGEQILLLSPSKPIRARPEIAGSTGELLAQSRCRASIAGEPLSLRPGAGRRSPRSFGRSRGRSSERNGKTASRQSVQHGEKGDAGSLPIASRSASVR